MKKAKHQRGDRTTFQHLLILVASQNAQRLVERAITANHLAKTLRGAARATAYAVKSEALVALNDKFPQILILRKDIQTPKYILIRSSLLAFSLHAPAHRFRSRTAA